MPLIFSYAFCLIILFIYFFCRCAELAIGIIVGCIPSVHKYYRHISKMGSSFKLRIPYITSSGGGDGGDGSSAPYWRRLFARSSSLDANRPRKFSGSTDSGSGSSAPHIKTLNMTRASFSLEEKEENNMPRPPAAVHIHGQTREETGRSRGMDNDDDETWERVEDVESGRGGAKGGGGGRDTLWQPNEGEGEVVHGKNGGANNETTRAQYEIHSRE